MEESEKKEMPKKTSGSAKEYLIFVALSSFMAGVVLFSGYWVWQKIKPPEREKKASIEKLSEEMPREKNAGEAKEIISEKTQTKEDRAISISAEETKVMVLNGGAPGGMAGKVRDALITAGFAKTEADNAARSDYKGATVHYEKRFAPLAEEIKKVVKKTYVNVEAREGMSEKEAKSDIVVILGD